MRCLQVPILSTALAGSDGIRFITHVNAALPADSTDNEIINKYPIRLCQLFLFAVESVGDEFLRLCGPVSCVDIRFANNNVFGKGRRCYTHTPVSPARHSHGQGVQQICPPA